MMGVKGMEKIRKLVEAAEIKLSDMCYSAKMDWQRMVKENHENAYASSVRYETLQMAATMMADLGQAAEREGKPEAIIVGWVCGQCGIDKCFEASFALGDFNFCPKCGRQIAEVVDYEEPWE